MIFLQIIFTNTGKITLLKDTNYSQSVKIFFFPNRVQLQLSSVLILRVYSNHVQPHTAPKRPKSHIFKDLSFPQHSSIQRSNDFFFGHTKKKRSGIFSKGMNVMLVNTKYAICINMQRWLNNGNFGFMQAEWWNALLEQHSGLCFNFTNWNCHQDKGSSTKAYNVLRKEWKFWSH